MLQCYRGKDHLQDPAGVGFPTRFLPVRRHSPDSPCCSASAPPPCPPGRAWWRAPPTERPHHRASWGQSLSPRSRDTWRQKASYKHQFENCVSLTRKVILGCRALHPSQQRLLGVALEPVHHLPLHWWASSFWAGQTFHRRVAVGEGLQGWQVTG